MAECCYLAASCRPAGRCRRADQALPLRPQLYSHPRLGKSQQDRQVPTDGTVLYPLFGFLAPYCGRLGGMARVEVLLADEINTEGRLLGVFDSWDEAVAEVERRCGGSLHRERGVATSTDDYTWTHFLRIVEYVSDGLVVYRLREYAS